MTPLGALNIILSNNRFEGYGTFRAICRLILKNIEGDIVIQGMTPKGLAYDIVSSAMDKYFDKNQPMLKKDMKAVLDLSPTASRTRTAVQLKIHQIYENLKSRR